MGRHRCRYPRWHRALILGGTVLYFHGAGYGMLRWLDVSPLWLPAAWLGSTWLVKHLLQWRCQGRDASDGRMAAALLLLVGSAAYLTHDDND